MKGTVLGFNEADGTGVISGEDGNRYSFSADDIQGGDKISRTSKVDFVVEDGVAKDIYRAMGAMDSLGDKNKFIAGALAIFLGIFGAHKFYLGRKKQGFIMLGTFFIGFILMITIIGAIIGAPLLWLLSILALIEGILMLIKPQDEFQRIYIDEGKAWF